MLDKLTLPVLLHRVASIDITGGTCLLVTVEGEAPDSGSSLGHAFDSINEGVANDALGTADVTGVVEAPEAVRNVCRGGRAALASAEVVWELAGAAAKALVFAAEPGLKVYAIEDILRSAGVVDGATVAWLTDVAVAFKTGDPAIDLAVVGHWKKRSADAVGGGLPQVTGLAVIVVMVPAQAPFDADLLAARCHDENEKKENRFFHFWEFFNFYLFSGFAFYRFFSYPIKLFLDF